MNYAVFNSYSKLEMSFPTCSQVPLSMQENWASYKHASLEVGRCSWVFTEQIKRFFFLIPVAQFNVCYFKIFLALFRDDVLSCRECVMLCVLYSAERDITCVMLRLYEEISHH